MLNPPYLQELVARIKEMNQEYPVTVSFQHKLKLEARYYGRPCDEIQGLTLGFLSLGVALICNVLVTVLWNIFLLAPLWETQTFRREIRRPLLGILSLGVGYLFALALANELFLWGESLFPGQARYYYE
jgi:hypothetical protein